MCGHSPTGHRKNIRRMSSQICAIRQPGRLKFLLPFLRWWPRINRHTLRDDFVAGLTGAIIVLPQGVAFATIAGMPPEYGLYAGMVPAIIAALFGSSWHLVSGPTTAASIVLYSVLSTHVAPGTVAYVQMALTLTFLVGVIQLGMGLARLGTLVNFISHSVVVGFTAGAAILIAANQIKHFFGITIPHGAAFHQTLATLFTNFSDIDPYITLVAGITLALGITVRRLLPRAPYLIVAMLGGSLIAASVPFLVTDAVVPAIGALPAALPPPSAPELSLDAVRKLGTGVIAVTLLALTEAVSIARALGARSGQVIDGNQEFIGQGLSNIIGSFFSGYVATGSFNRSGANHAAGAKTPLAAVFAGVLLMGIVLLVAPYAAYLPNAAMAGVLFLVAWGLIDFRHIRQIVRTSRAETVILGVTFMATLFLDLEAAILLGVMLSLGIYLSQTSRPRIVNRVPDPGLPKRKFSSDPELAECPQVKILRIDGSLFFGAVNHVQESLNALTPQPPAQKHLVLVASGINFVDIAGAEFLAAEARRRRLAGGGLYFIRVKAQVRAVLDRGDYIRDIGHDHFFDSKGDAVAQVYRRLDPEICRTCRLRIFRECGGEAVATAPPAISDAPPIRVTAHGI